MSVESNFSFSRNHLLGALSREEFTGLPGFQRLDLPKGEVVCRAGEPITSVIFPETGWISLVVRLGDGSATEVGIIGREGMVGIPLLLDDDRGRGEWLVQNTVTAWRLSADALRKALHRNPSFRTRVYRYVLAFVAHTAQIAVCNNRHHVEQRLARWMLMAHDRVGSNTFPITHEFLSQMLGVRRAGVTVAAGALQRGGVIRYERGMMTVTNRAGLEAASCECYRAVRREFERLVGSPGESSVGGGDAPKLACSNDPSQESGGCGYSTFSFMSAPSAGMTNGRAMMDVSN